MSGRHRELFTVYRFALVGALATLVHLAVAGSVVFLLPASSPFLANIAGFLVAFFVSFAGHRHYTFRRKGSMRRFFVIALAGFALNNGLLSGIIAAEYVGEFAAITVATLAVPLLTFLAARLWAFGARPWKDSTADSGAAEQKQAMPAHGPL
jgi:putative flippase GtrA